MQLVLKKVVCYNDYMLNTISYSIVFLSKKVEDLQETVGDGAIISIKDVFF